MCFGGSNKGLKRAIAQQNYELQLARKETAKAQAENQKLQKQALKLQQQQLQFQKEQAEYVKETDAKIEALVSRPPPPPAGGSGTIETGGTGEGDQAAVDSRKKGRQALRIDLNAPQMAGNTGLNVPRG